MRFLGRRATCPEGVCHDADAGDAVDEGAEVGVQLPSEEGEEYAGRERNQKDVVEEGPEEVLADGA